MLIFASQVRSITIAVCACHTGHVRTYVYALYPFKTSRFLFSRRPTFPRKMRDFAPCEDFLLYGTLPCPNLTAQNIPLNRMCGPEQSKEVVPEYAYYNGIMKSILEETLPYTMYPSPQKCILIQGFFQDSGQQGAVQKHSKHYWIRTCGLCINGSLYTCTCYSVAV